MCVTGLPLLSVDFASASTGEPSTIAAGISTVYLPSTTVVSTSSLTGLPSLSTPSMVTMTFSPSGTSVTVPDTVPAFGSISAVIAPSTRSKPPWSGVFGSLS